MKRFPTFITLKGFLSCMSSPMLNESWLLAESFPIFITFIAFFSCVSFLMLIEGWLLVKRLPTFTAFVGFLSCMNPLMDHGGWLLLEGFPTFNIFIGLLPCMCPLMHCESYLQGIFTCDWMFSHVHYIWIASLLSDFSEVESEVWHPAAIIFNLIAFILFHFHVDSTERTSHRNFPHDHYIHRVSPRCEFPYMGLLQSFFLRFFHHYYI